MISTRNLKELPSVDKLKRLCQSLAVLEAILSPEWDLRYYSFDANWNEDSMLASMNTGSGSSYFILFSPSGVVIKGDAHETTFERFSVTQGKPWPGVLDAIPSEFNYFLNEPAFSAQEATFLIWQKYGDRIWSIGDVRFPTENDPDGSAELLTILDGNPSTYKVWSEEYYDRDIPIECVSHIYRHEPITEEVLVQLNPDVNLAELTKDLSEIGFVTPH